MIEYEDDSVVLHHGDALEVLRTLPDSSVDAVVTDPPYGLSFMGKAWDSHAPLAFQQWCTDWATECLRVLKPGGHLLAFGGSRTWHRLAAAVEDAGFEIRDSIAWLYGSGFPKSLDVSKAIDKAAGATREVIGPYVRRGDRKPYAVNSSSTVEFNNAATKGDITGPATPAAEQWSGWGTALKPAFEPIVVGRKPLVGTVAANVLLHGTGALNIDACRVSMGAEYDPAKIQRQTAASAGMKGLGDSGFASDHEQPTYNAAGRWPANVLLDGDQADELDAQTGVLTSGKLQPHHADHGKDAGTLGAMGGAPGRESYGDSGGASRFFPVFRYQAKAPKSERPSVDGVSHPTVKPLALMRWLIRLVTPPGGTVLEPFAGSGTTVEACIREGFRCIAIEREAEYLPLILSRVLL